MATPSLPVSPTQQQALTDAFEVFTQASEQLVSEYHVLEQRVVLLTTEVRGLKEQLHRNQRLSSMGEMVARLAHQLRTPLASALLYVSHLHRVDLPHADRQRFAGKVAGRLHHLEHLINDMLSFARGAELGMTCISVEELLNELVQTVEPPLRERGGRMTIAPFSAGLNLRAQRDGLLGALLNICTNAWEVAGNGVHIHLEVAAAGPQHLEFRISDNGPGVPAHLQERIFEPFYTTRGGGTGLGLAVVRAVAEGHGGEVCVRSREGTGSMFVIRLPREGGQGALPSGARSWATTEDAQSEFSPALRGAGTVG